jgi:nucleoid-associated protein YgaU
MTAIKAKRRLNRFLGSIFTPGGKRTSHGEQHSRSTREADTDAHGQLVLGPDRVYVVGVGDSLTRIAQRTMGDAGRWPEILEANKELMKGEGLIRVGQKLRIPEE